RQQGSCSCPREASKFHVRCEWLCLRSCSGFSCGDSHPLRDVFSVQRPAAVTTVTTTEFKATAKENMLKRTDGEVTLMYSEEAGTQILQQQDSLTDYNPLQSTQQDLQQDQQQDRQQDQQQDQQQVQDQQQDSAESVRPSEPRLQAFTLLEVSRTLWIPRYTQNLKKFVCACVCACMCVCVCVCRRGGDVMVIELQSHGDELRGRVTAVLSPPGRSSLG
ncbi:hypothetical protein KUCAC02_037704, partial [Chaenocephalus aceratus]